MIEIRIFKFPGHYQLIMPYKTGGSEGTSIYMSGNLTFEQLIDKLKQINGNEEVKDN